MDDSIITTHLDAQQEQQSPDKNRGEWREPCQSSMPQQAAHDDAARHHQNNRQHIFLCQSEIVSAQSY